MPFLDLHADNPHRVRDYNISSYEQIDQLLAWSMLIGVGKLKVKFCSPMRSDRNPNCELIVRDGRVKLMDCSKALSWDLIDVYRHLHPEVSVPVARQKIIEMVGHSVRNGRNKTTVYTGGDIKSGRVKQTEWNERYVIDEWNESYLNFWAGRGVSMTQMEPKSGPIVRPLRAYTCSEVLGPKTFRKECFGFLYKIPKQTVKTIRTGIVDSFSYKRYCPYESAGYAKFGGNVSRNNFWLTNTGCDSLLVTKSNKDFLVWQTLTQLCDFAAFGSESTFPEDALLTELIRKHRIINICFDPDNTGQESSLRLGQILERLAGENQLPLKVGIWNFPCEKHKDVDAYRAAHTHEETLTFLRKHKYSNFRTVEQQKQFNKIHKVKNFTGIPINN